MQSQKFLKIFLQFLFVNFWLNICLYIYVVQKNRKILRYYLHLEIFCGKIRSAKNTAKFVKKITEKSLASDVKQIYRCNKVINSSMVY